METFIYKHVMCTCIVFFQFGAKSLSKCLVQFYINEGRLHVSDNYIAFKEFQSEMRIINSNNFKLCSFSDLMYMHMVI